MNNGILRESSSFERIMFHYASKEPAFFAFRIRFTGQCDEARLRTALAKARVQYPLSAVRVEHDGQKRQYLRTDSVPDYPLTVITDPSISWTETIIRGLQEPFDHSAGPMARFTLLTHTDAHDLIAIFHHAVVDGIGALVFLEYLMNCLSDPTIEPTAPDDLHRAPMLHRIIHPDNLRKIQEKGIPDYFVKKEYLNIDILPYTKPVFRSPRFSLHTASFSADKTQTLIMHARRHEVSIHAYLGALVMSVFAEQFGPADGYERTIQCPVNFRPQLIPEARKMFGLFNGIVKAKAACTPDREIADIAQEVGTKIREDVDSLEPLAGYYNFMSYYLEGVQDPERLYESRTDGPMKMDYDFSFSNVGRLDWLLSGSDIRIQEIHGPVFSALRGERVIGALTFNGRLCMTMIYDPDNFNDELGGILWTRICERVDKLPPVNDVDNRKNS